MKQEKLNRDSHNFLTEQDNFMISFRTNLEIYAKENKLTLKQVSELADISFATLNSFLYGNTKDCRLSTAVKLSRAFGISIDELVGAATISADVRKSINIVRKFPRKTRYLLRWIIRYQQKILTEDRKSKIINIMIPENRNNQGMIYSDQYTSIDISSCDKEIKSKVFLGIQIQSEDYMPKYVPGDTLLIANDRIGMDEDDYIIIYYEKIIIAKRKVVGEKIKYVGVRDHLFEVWEDEIDMVMGYVAGVLCEEEQ